MKDFQSFVNEAKKKWYSGNKDYEDSERRSSRDYGYEGDFIAPGEGDDDYIPDDDPDYDPDDDPDAFDPDDDPEAYGGGGYYGGGYGLDPVRALLDQIAKEKIDFKAGDNVVYLGNTGNRRNQKATVVRLRDDGKIVVRFEDKKLIAVRRDRLMPEGYEPPKPPPIPERKPLDDLKPGQKWWEKNKKSDADEKI